MVSYDMSATEEFLNIISLHECTRGHDILDSFINCVECTNFSICKLVLMTTGEAPAKIGSKSGLVVLCREEKLYILSATFKSIEIG